LNSLTTAQLIERCQTGDTLAVELLLREYQQGVFRLAVSVLDDPAEADEVTQEVFLARFNPDGSLDTTFSAGSGCAGPCPTRW
jgi:RNA polymerase sigma-70 factor, ECF subfamily